MKEELNEFEEELEKRLKALCKKFKFDWKIFEKKYEENVFNVLTKAFLFGKDKARRDLIEKFREIMIDCGEDGFIIKREKWEELQP